MVLHRFPPVFGFSSFFAAFLLAAITSGSLLTQRLAHGAPAPFFWGLIAMGAALLVWASAEPREVRVRLPAHLAGAVAGTMLIHLVFAAQDPLLVESASQWMNDGVFLAAIFAAVWGLRLEAGSAVAALLLATMLGAYRFTALHWHVDHFPGSTVQDFVLRQSLAVALGLLVFDVVWSQRSVPH